MKRLVLFGFLVALLIHVTPVAAQVRTDVSKTITELQEKISQLQGQASSLAKEISLKNSQIALIELKITGARITIEKLTAEIAELTQQVEELERLKTRRLELTLHRAPESYKRHRVSLVGFLLLGQNFSDVLARMKYLSRVQEEDARLYKQLQLTQTNYNERKDAREKKRLELELLKRELEAQSRELVRAKREKQSLLEQTKNSEAVYQQLLAQALAERQALERAIVEGVKVGPVKKGDPIGLVGNTGYPGCSTGPHLHFEVRKNNAWIDPAEYLSGKTVFDDQDRTDWTVGRGSWPWPLVDTIRLTQRFGQTPYSWRYSYSGGIHTGFDMTSTGSEVIRATADGTLYASSQACGSGSIIKIKYVDHGDGVSSFYLHVQ